MDVSWATRLVGALAKASVQRPLPWHRSRGVPAWALDEWLTGRGWVRLAAWHWQHHLAQVGLVLRPRGLPAKAAVGRAQHAVREAWRAWIALKWEASERHELRNLDVRWHRLRLVQWDDARKWADSCAEAATVSLGATFSPAHWAVINERDSSQSFQSDRCIWPGCQQYGTADHIRWSCPFRPSRVRRLRSPLLARFGWSCRGDDRATVQATREWLVTVQRELWQVTHGL